MQGILGWFRKRWPQEVEDPVLGCLRYEYDRWIGGVARGGERFFISIVPAQRHRDDPQLRELARQVLEQLTQREQLARSFVAASGPPARWAGIQLTGIMLCRANKDWIRITLRRTNPDAARLLSQGMPLTSLEFAIPGDPNNILDVLFAGDTPIELDYH